jgi:hypothetical protein
MSSAPRKDPRGSRRAVSGRLAAALEARYLKLHAQLIADNRPMSGRAGGYVYYWAYGRLCWRRYVVPKDPRTATQQSSRAAFGAASLAWSENQALTEEQRDAWYAEAAKLKTRPRLAQSGALTAQQHFIGRNSIKERWGLALLWEPPARKAIMPEAPRRQGVARPSSGTRRACAAPVPSLPQPARACAKEAIGTFCLAQVPFLQRLTRPSSDRPPTTSRPLPEQCRWQARSPGHVGSIGSPRLSSTIAQIRRKARFRELWRGG